MEMETLLKRLDELAWDEQMAFEMSERDPDSWEEDQHDLQMKMRALAGSLQPSDLDALENEPGYQVWSLRLSPYVTGADPVARARRLLQSDDARVRRWAQNFLEKRH